VKVWGGAHQHPFRMLFVKGDGCPALRIAVRCMPARSSMSTMKKSPDDGDFLGHCAEAAADIHMLR